MTPKQLAECEIAPRLVEIPSTWGELGVSQKGVATYRIHLKVPANRYYTLSFRQIYLSHKVWVNGHEYPAAGVVSHDKKIFSPNVRPKEYEFFAENSDVEILFQVANLAYRKGGVANAVTIGSSKAVATNVFEKISYETFTVGEMLFAFILLFIILIFSKVNFLENIYFVLFLLFQTLDVVLSGEIILTKFIHFSWLIESKLWNITVWGRSLFLFLFVASVVGKNFNNLIKKIAVILAAIFVAFILIAPPEIYTVTFPVYIFYAFLLIFYSIYIVIISIKTNKYLYLTLLGLVIILLVGVHDILVEYSILKGIYIAQFGLFFFIFLQLFYVSIVNAKLLESENQTLLNLDIQTQMNIELLSRATFDIFNSLKIFVEISNIDKVLIFFAENEKLYFSHRIIKYSAPKIESKEVDFSKTNSQYCVDYLKETYEKRTPIHKNYAELKLSDKKYFKERKIRNLFIVPVIKDGRLFAIVYLEKQNQMLSSKEEHLVIQSFNFLQNLIVSSHLYTELHNANENLKLKIDERRQKIAIQNEKIERKNLELNEKIQFIEEQIILQKEISEGIKTQKKELKKQNELLEVVKWELEDEKKHLDEVKDALLQNIYYARRLIEITEQVEQNPPFEYFYHFSKPRGVVGGDFLWSQAINDKFIFSLADSTGHGIPGAFLVLLGTKLLKDIVNRNIKENPNFNSADILNELRREIKKHLTEKDEKIQEGYDMSMCIYYPETKKMSVACAYNSIFIVRDNKIIHIKAQRMPVGAHIREVPFTNEDLQLQNEDTIYLFTDGFIDQFGGADNSKFYMVNFKNLVLKISNKSPNEQKEILEKTFRDWKGQRKQIDDVSIACFKVNDNLTS